MIDEAFRQEAHNIYFSVHRKSRDASILSQRVLRHSTNMSKRQTDPLFILIYFEFLTRGGGVEGIVFQSEGARKRYKTFPNMKIPYAYFIVEETHNLSRLYSISS